MDLTGKLEAEVEIGSSGDLFHELWSNAPHETCNIHPELLQSCDLHEGEFGKTGTILLWNYVLGIYIIDTRKVSGVFLTPFKTLLLM